MPIHVQYWTILQYCSILFNCLFLDIFHGLNWKVELPIQLLNCQSINLLSYPLLSYSILSIHPYPSIWAEQPLPHEAPSQQPPVLGLIHFSRIIIQQPNEQQGCGSKGTRWSEDKCAIRVFNGFLGFAGSMDWCKRNVAGIHARKNGVDGSPTGFPPKKWPAAIPGFCRQARGMCTQSQDQLHQNEKLLVARSWGNSLLEWSNWGELPRGSKWTHWRCLGKIMAACLQEIVLTLKSWSSKSSCA
jgi:hypothetical protein